MQNNSPGVAVISHGACLYNGNHMHMFADNKARETYVAGQECTLEYVSAPLYHSYYIL
jgi:hypothetical protein